VRRHTGNAIRKVLYLLNKYVTGMLTHVKTDMPVASLTFDDGPDPVYTLKLIDILKEYDVRATFFMVGEAAKNYPDVIEKVAREGHAIGNHSWSHPSLPSIPMTEKWRQISKCHKALAPYGQRLFRPPYGISDNRTDMCIYMRGYKNIGWSYSPDDWKETNLKAMLEGLVENIKPGSIILLHDRIFARTDAEVLAKKRAGRIFDREPMLYMLKELLNRNNGNINFVTIPLLLQYGKPQRARQ
jgi:peptidoglycan-N-acetylglucosamine deacetylase